MSIYGAMYAGVSGLRAQSSALGMIADNIANVNTVGYKSSKASFSTLVTESAFNTQYTSGGVRASQSPGVDKQGLLQASTANTDLAVAGNGFFVVHENASSIDDGTFLYTRAGSFRKDASGNLVNSAGYYLKGWELDQNGDPIGNTSVLSSLETINIANLSGSASATSSVELNLNLPSTDATATTHEVSVQVYDALGNAHDLTIEWSKTAENAWSYTVQDPTLAEDGVVSGSITAGATGSITFDGTGTPIGPDADADGIIDTTDIVVDWTTGGANDSTISLNLGSIGEADGVTQFAGDYAITLIEQNGVQFGQFTEVSIGEEGIVTAIFNNGERRDIYKLPLALFDNVNGLEARDGNAYQMTDRSGDLILVGAATGGAGRMVSGTLESSTVDLAEEFANMIVTQRAYQASAKVITTADEMLDELLRI
jgi:flagellar hook protein FlgE